MQRLRSLENYADDRGNVVSYNGGSLKAPIDIRFRGEGNVLEIAENAKIVQLTVDFFGDGGKVVIAGTPKPRTGLRFGIRVGQQASVSIGENVGSQSRTYIVASEGASVSIGEDCMLSSHIEIRTDDSHAIYDVRTGDRINHARPIRIGNHVWVGKHVAVLGGVTIGDGAVVGFRSVVTRDVPNNSIAVGSPAKVVRKNIAWERPRLNFREPGQQQISPKEKTESYWNMTEGEPVEIRSTDSPSIWSTAKSQLKAILPSPVVNLIKRKRA